MALRPTGPAGVVGGGVSGCPVLALFSINFNRYAFFDKGYLKTEAQPRVKKKSGKVPASKGLRHRLPRAEGAAAPSGSGGRPGPAQFP
jgi:hypothetical protein